MNNQTLFIIYMIMMIIPIILVISGIVLWLKTPRMNSFFGYRTRKTLTDEKKWVLANKLWGKLSLIGGILHIIIWGLILFFRMFDTYFIISMVYMTSVITTFIVQILVVEIYLHNKD